jgi:hypothetical protein
MYLALQVSPPEKCSVKQETDSHHGNSTYKISLLSQFLQHKRQITTHYKTQLHVQEVFT